jgi:hypothetical protein
MVKRVRSGKAGRTCILCLTRGNRLGFLSLISQGKVNQWESLIREVGKLRESFGKRGSAPFLPYEGV